MNTILVVSSEPGSGKTSVICGMGCRLKRDGYRVSYFKPVTNLAQGAPTDKDLNDLEFLRATLGLDLAAHDVSPVGITSEGDMSIVTGRTEESASDAIGAAFMVISADQDLVLAEGPSDWNVGESHHIGASDLASLLDAKVIVVLRGRFERVVEEADEARRKFGARFIGIVVNQVSAKRLEKFAARVAPELRNRGYTILAIHPAERFFFAVTAAELATTLEGNVATAQDCTDVLVEDVMVGTMSLDLATHYFFRKQNKAVVTAIKKPEIQFGALNTSTRCLILGGKGSLSPVVAARAEELGVPTIISPKDTFATIEAIERAFGAAGFHHAEKLKRLDTMMAERFDFVALYQAMGWRPRS